MLLSILSLLLQAATLTPVASATPLQESSRTTGPRVPLGYATYEGTSLANGVSQFLGMRYAAPPLGNNRLRLPVDPPKETGVVSAKKHGVICYTVGGITTNPAPLPAGEDCLFIEVYTPTKAIPTRSNANSTQGLPVMVWLQGGAFVSLFNPNYNGSGIIQANGGNVIVVSFNYRVGPQGFLASKELQQEGNLNIGLHDQRFALSWVQKHIAAFGGDPKRVTLFGTSVGAGSVLLQTLAYGGNPPKGDTAVWKYGIATAPYTPSVYQVSDLQYQYDALLKKTNCTGLPCLRSLDSETFQAANIATPFPGESQVGLFPSWPVIDHKLFSDHPSAMLQAGKFSRARPLIIGSSRTEGTVFVPQANTTAEINGFLKEQYPSLTQTDLDKAQFHYLSVPKTYPGVTTKVSRYYYRAAMMYGDVAFSCPTFKFASALSKAGVDIYFLRDNIIDPVELAAGYIVPHTWEVDAVWGPDYAIDYVVLPGADSYKPGGVNAVMVPLIQGYWNRFTNTGNPNLKGYGPGVPAWNLYSDKHQRLKLQANATIMESLSKKELDRCAFWDGLTSRTRV